jgi:hypothetical protein
MTMSAQTIGRELAKIAVNLEQSNAEGFDRYFGAFVVVAGYINVMRENGVEYSTRAAFDVEVTRLRADRD